MTTARSILVSIVGIVLFATPASVSAQASQAEAKRTAMEQGAVNAERAVLDALKTRDWATFNRYISGLTYVDFNGINPNWDTKQTADMLKDVVTNGYTMTDVHTRVVSPDVVVLTYKVDIDQVSGGSRVLSPVYSMSVWRRKGGQWHAIAHSEANAKDAK